MSTWYIVFLFSFIFSPLMFYGIGLETVFQESESLKRFLCRLPLLAANVFLTILVVKPFSILMGSFSDFVCLVPLVIFVVSSILSAVSVLIAPYSMTEGRTFSGFFSFGLSLLAVLQGCSLPDALLIATSGVISFVIVAVILSAVNDRMQYSDVPVFFKGIPTVFITLGLLMLLFYAAGISWWIVE